MDANAIASAGVPVLCIDTCSILDVMRDPTRESAKVHERQAAIDLVAAAEAGKLACVVAEQVAIEFAEYDQPVQDEAERNLSKIREEIERINKLSSVYGAPGTERWLRNFEQGVKWKLGLTAGMFCLRIRSEDEEASPPEPHTGLQGEGGPCCPEKRSNDCTAC